MSEIEKVEQKIDSYIARQDHSNTRLENALEKVSDTLTTFIGFQARAEERQLADCEWQKSVEKHQDKQDERIEFVNQDFTEFKNTDFQAVRDGQKRNTLITNGVIGIGGTLLGVLLSTLFLIPGG